MLYRPSTAHALYSHYVCTWRTISAMLSSNYIAAIHNSLLTQTYTTHPGLSTPLPSTTLQCMHTSNTRHTWHGTRCRDGGKYCGIIPIYVVWLVFEGFIPTCACFHSENFFVTLVIRTARRTKCHNWDSKVAKPGSQFSPALREWESFGIQLRPLGNAAYVACLLLFCQGFEWLNGKSVWLVFRRSWVQIPAGSQIFFRGYISNSLNKKHHILL